eukprot:798770-Pleurochrysis_carterae.AAC.1
MKHEPATTCKLFLKKLRDACSIFQWIHLANNIALVLRLFGFILHRCSTCNKRRLLYALDWGCSLLLTWVDRMPPEAFEPSHRSDGSSERLAGIASCLQRASNNSEGDDDDKSGGSHSTAN